jgi:alginate O-acetyltransferase complex protein AlgI
VSFDAFPFWVFLLAVWCAYLFVSNNTARKGLLIAASYFFYATWHAPYVVLLAGVTAGSYWVGGVARKGRHRTLLLAGVWASVALLAVAKRWLNPFPVGVSFYILQSIAYMVDCYRGHWDGGGLFDYALHMSFFPRLTAGPIVRADEFLPQLAQRVRVTSTDLWEALVFICFGLFEKFAIADNLAVVVDPVFQNLHTSGSRVLLATYAFAVQIYCDFSGYSNMAIGTARLFGYRLPMNFNWPYLATNPAEFWRRWHISLSNWLRDYVYFSLPGLRSKSRIFTYRNLCVTMLVCGLWHGIAWPFALWGLYHGALLSGYYAIGSRRKASPKKLSGIRALGSVFLMQQLAVIGWIVFRVNRISDLKSYTASLATASFFSGFNSAEWMAVALLISVGLFHLVAWRLPVTDIAVRQRWNPWVLTLLLLVALATVTLGVSQQQVFLYFRF